MNLDEAIKHCEEVAEKYDTEINLINCGISNESVDECLECASEHRQLAEWLRELKKYRAIFEKIGRILHENGYTMDDLDTIFGKANDEGVKVNDE